MITITECHARVAEQGERVALLRDANTAPALRLHSTHATVCAILGLAISFLSALGFVSMTTELLTAIYRDGAFVPDQMTAVPLGTRVRLLVQPMPDELETQRAIDEFDALCEEVDINAPGSHLSRDQLHERD